MSDAVEEELLRRARVARGALVWEADVRGTICHQVIAEMCRQRVRDPAGIAPVAVALLPPRLAVVHRRALLAFVVPRTPRWGTGLRDPNGCHPTT